MSLRPAALVRELTRWVPTVLAAAAMVAVTAHVHRLRERQQRARAGEEGNHGIFPVPERRTRSIDWAAAARLAANSVGAAEVLARGRRRASGELPWGATDRAGSASPPPAFPWSRQPLTSWMDFDPTKLLTTVHLGRHCVLVFFLVMPAFGCVLRHIDPDPGRGALFAAKFAPRPLEIPEPPLPQPRAPQYNDVVGRRQSRLHQ